MKRPITTRLPENHCPQCRAVLSAVSHSGEEQAEDVYPDPGDLTICVYCETALVFTDDLSLRCVTEEDRRDPEFIKALERMQAEWRRFLEWSKAQSEPNPQFAISWIDHKREAQVPPNPNYPKGIDLVLAVGTDTCYTLLPYPAPRCGTLILECQRCGLRVGITTAGRSDDPRSLRIACGPKPKLNS